ncbi:MAG: uroporphyrinogen-III synthase [Tannerellaceae bacterium]|jgi:uroporphyrinogen-III synthase|nr:uroporphyrinogen-III synthase [Tannerellaceae bacterium]
MAVRKTNILVTQPRPASGKSPYDGLAEKYGLKIDFHPLVEITPVSVKDFRKQRIELAEHTAVILTSRTAIDHYFRICEGMRFPISEGMKYFCATEAIAVYLQKYTVYRKRKIFFGPDGKPNGIFVPIAKHPKESFLVPVSDVHNDDLFALLESKKIVHRKVVLFRTVSVGLPPEVALSDYDMILLFSPAGVSALRKHNPDFEQGQTLIGCFGAATAKAITESGLRLDLQAPTPEAPSMVNALELYIKKHLTLRR